MTQSKISVAKDFSRYPAGRYKADGPASGEEFLETFLLPTLKAGQSQDIELDGTRGYGSSFLEEAFGGAVRKGYDPEVVKRSFKLITADKSLVEEIHEYIDQGNADE